MSIVISLNRIGMWNVVYDRCVSAHNLRSEQEAIEDAFAQVELNPGVYDSIVTPNRTIIVNSTVH